MRPLEPCPSNVTAQVSYVPQHIMLCLTEKGLMRLDIGQSSIYFLFFEDLVSFHTPQFIAKLGGLLTPESALTLILKISTFKLAG